MSLRLKTINDCCRHGLKENGVIVVKENVTSLDKIEIDTEDSSVTRPYGELQRIFKLADLICIKEQKQNGMPRGLYPIYMFALKPQTHTSEPSSP